MTHPSIRAFLAAIIATCVAACGDDRIMESFNTTEFSGPPAGMAVCGSAPFLSTAPVSLAELANIVPLGNLNPGGHTFPSDHVYLVLARAGSADPPKVNVVSPGEIRVTGIASSSNTQNGAPHTDYSIYFYSCTDVQFYFHHVQSLAPTLLNAFGTSATGCSTYTTGGDTYTRCNKMVDVALHAGDLVGTVGGAGSLAFDLGAYDRRTPKLAFVNQTYPDFGSNEFNTFHTVCPLDYFTASIKQSLQAKLGNGVIVRTAAPACGTIMQDVANTAQGRWLKGTSQQEDTHLALVHDNVDPAIGAISMGSSVPTVPLGVYKFAPASSAASRINTDFSSVMVNGQIYCYENFSSAPGGTGTRHVLLQLTSATALKIEGVIGATCGSAATWEFSGAAVTFAR